METTTIAIIILSIIAIGSFFWNLVQSVHIRELKDTALDNTDRYNEALKTLDNYKSKADVKEEEALYLEESNKSLRKNNISLQEINKSLEENLDTLEEKYKVDMSETNQAIQKQQESINAHLSTIKEMDSNIELKADIIRELTKEISIKDAVKQDLLKQVSELTKQVNVLQNIEETKNIDKIFEEVSKPTQVEEQLVLEKPFIPNQTTEVSKDVVNKSKKKSRGKKKGATL